MIKVCSLFSGSSGNCIYISYKDTAVLIDAGVSGKRIENALSSIGESFEKIAGIFITHEHSDHISGAGVLSRRYQLPVYANASTWKAIGSSIGKIKSNHKCHIEPGEDISIGDIGVKSFFIPHDAANPVGYNLIIKDKKLSIATDIGHMDDELMKNLEKSDMVLLESNHDTEMLKCGRYPWPLKQRILGEKGHLCNEIAGEVITHLAKAGTKQFLLGHLSQENNFPELAYKTVSNALLEANINPLKDIYLEVALRDRVSKVLCL